jgi:excisionase family DNA binding protein
VDSLLVDSHEAASLLGLSKRTLWNITVPRGTLPCVRIRKAVRFDRHDLLAFVKANKVTMEGNKNEVQL